MHAPIMQDCQLCGHRHQRGPGRHDGRTIADYRLSVCNGCFNANWDGWGPALEPAFVTHLARVGIPLPERNEKGWYPRGD